MGSSTSSCYNTSVKGPNEGHTTKQETQELQNASQHDDRGTDESIKPTGEHVDEVDREAPIANPVLGDPHRSTIAENSEHDGKGSDTSGNSPDKKVQTTEEPQQKGQDAPKNKPLSAKEQRAQQLAENNAKQRDPKKQSKARIKNEYGGIRMTAPRPHNVYIV